MAEGSLFRGKIKWLIFLAVFSFVVTFTVVRMLTKQAEGPSGEDKVFPVYGGRPANWTYYASDKEGRHYYSKVDDANPSQSSGVVRVWARLDFSEEGKKLYLAKRNSVAMPLKGYDQLARRNVLYELNCFSTRREFSTQEVFDLTPDGKTLDYAKAGSYKDWQDVPPDSVLDELCKIVCPPKRD
jgi:hypothetical protein